MKGFLRLKWSWPKWILWIIWKLVMVNLHRHHAHERQTLGHRHTDTVTQLHRLMKLAQSVQAYVWVQPSWQRETESAPSLCSTELSLSPGLDWLSVDNHCTLWMWTHTNVEYVHTEGHNHARTHTHTYIQMNVQCPNTNLKNLNMHEDGRYFCLFYNFSDG